jgi:CxxC-x17-CxxC domain-containing protein
MEPQFVDRILTCSDCHGEFIFTAGEQLFFYDKQFKNDPKRCKPCKSRRSGLSAAANGTGPAAAGLSRTETRTECSECGIQTTVPFKPTQGRPVLCRQCFQAKGRAAASKPAEAAAQPLPLAASAPTPIAPGAETVAALQQASANSRGDKLSPDAAVGAAASMAAASPRSSVASAADLASITPASATHPDPPGAVATAIPAELVAAAANGDGIVYAQELRALAADSPEA